MTLKKSALLTFCFTTSLMTAHYTAHGSPFALITLVTACVSLYSFLSEITPNLDRTLITISLFIGLSGLMGVKAGLPFGESIYLISAAVLFVSLKNLKISNHISGKKFDESISASSASIGSASGGSSIKK